MTRTLLIAAAALTVACDQPLGVEDCADCVGDERAVPGQDESGDLMEAPGSACGNVWYVDMTVTGHLTDADGDPIQGADVWLEERAWMPTSIHGEGKTRENGSFEFDVQAVPIVEDCWGWAALFHVVGERGNAWGEIDVNMQIVRAWQDETFIADVSSLPFVLVED